MNFVFIDYLVFGGYCCLIFGVGLWVSREKEGHVKDTNDYFLASKSFPWWAIAGRKSMVITHSEIFPGTYASTTETATWIIREAGLTRAPVLRWGPQGMQLLSEASEGRLYILGFAGNASPDHIDHYHGMPTFLSALLSE